MAEQRVDRLTTDINPEQTITITNENLPPFVTRTATGPPGNDTWSINPLFGHGGSSYQFSFLLEDGVGNKTISFYCVIEKQYKPSLKAGYATGISLIAITDPITTIQYSDMFEDKNGHPFTYDNI